MSTLKLLDPEIRPALDAFPEIELTTDILPQIRDMSAQMIQMEDAASCGVARQSVSISGLSDDAPDVKGLLYTPLGASGPSGAYLHIHGGGYILGSAEASDAHNLRLSQRLGITILSVNYRLAPEHAAPAGLNDCYAALAWLYEKAEDLGVDPARIAIGGESAGGGLAAALAIHARDQGAYPICFQLLTYPMLDDRTGDPDHFGDPLTGEFVWTRDRNRFGWDCYLGDAAPAAPVVPARAESLEGLPPAWIGTAALDLFRDENIVYAQRLMGVAIATELIVYPGACHGFQMAPDAGVTKQYLRDHEDALARALRPNA